MTVPYEVIFCYRLTLMSIFSRIFGNKKDSPASKTAPHVVIAEFAEFIETHTSALGCAADVQELPFPKKDIRVAILLMLAATRDPKLQEHLAYAYLLLPRWQEGVGPTNIGLDVSKLDRTQTPQELAKEVLACAEEMKKWQPMIDAEKKALLDDLRTTRPGFEKLAKG
jgi:hypothetical protein